MSDLIKLTIDGVEIEVPKGTLVVDAAKRIGNDIPVFCHHPKLEPVGMCRMCLVEIGYPVRDRATGELQLDEDGNPRLIFRGLQTACTTQVSEGIAVRTTTDVVEAAQKSTLEFLLSSHPLDCPICDKGGECPLQNLTMAHGQGTSRMHFDDKLKLGKHVPLGELIFLDQERCIQCARCIRFQDEIVDDPVIHFHNRGRSTEIVTYSNPGFNSYWSGNTTDICPVGALTTADFRFGARPWEMTPVASLCTHCPVGCNTTMSTRFEAIAGGRRVIKRVMPRQNEAVNEIWICDKGRFAHQFADDADRLKTPLVRKNGELAETGWTEALDLVAGKLQQHRTAVAGISGDRLSNEDLFLFQKLFRQGLASNNIDLVDRRLAGGEVVAKVGLSSGSNLKELGSADAIIVVATDLHEEAPVWWLRVKQAAERGTAVIVLNARPTRLDKYASYVWHYPVGQAVDAIHQLVNWVKVDTVVTNGNTLAAAAEAIAHAANLVAFFGSEGITYAESEAIARLLANLLLLKNGGGHAGKVNNGLIPVWPHSNTQGAWDMGIHPAYGPGYSVVDAPGLNAARIYAGAANGSLKALFILGADPIGDGLMAGRGQLDFLVVQELFLTETAASADVVLPAQSWAEREGTFTNGERRVQRYYPAIAPVGDNRADWQILAEIGERVGLGKLAFAASLVFRDIANAVPQYKGMDYRSLAKVVKQWPDVGGEDAYYGGNAYDNKAGLGQQWPTLAELESVASFDVPETAVQEVDGTVLMRTAALYTPGTLINLSDVLAPRLAKPMAVVSETDASAYGLATGDLVNLTIQETAAIAQAVVDSNLSPGLVLLSGVPYFPGTVAVQISKLEKAEELA